LRGDDSGRFCNWYQFVRPAAAWSANKYKSCFAASCGIAKQGTIDESQRQATSHEEVVDEREAVGGEGFGP
jgi:hypothetical protein